MSDEYVGYWLRRRAEQRLWNQRLAKRARADLERIVAVLVGEFGAERIILFGSLARGCFAPGSDIDLALAGISPADFIVAMARVNSLTSLWVDLKPLEELEPHFCQRVLATGELLYARSVE